MSVSKAIKENDEEERHAMSLAAHVDRAAAKCVRQQPQPAAEHSGHSRVQWESKINGHMKTAVKSFSEGVPYPRSQGTMKCLAGRLKRSLQTASAR